MTDVKANELEFQSLVVSWLYQELGRDATKYPFDLISANPSIKIGADATRFPDIEIWINRQAGQGFCDIELKTPATPVDDPELLEKAAEKSRAMKAEYFMTWNMRDTVIWRTPPAETKVDRVYRLHTYRSLDLIQEPDDLHRKHKKQLLQDRARAILEDLAELYRKGHLHLLDMDATFFVGLLTETAQQLAPHCQASLNSAITQMRGFHQELANWAVRQAIANYDDLAFIELVSRQMVYRTLGKILFYETLRRFRSELPPFILKGHTDFSARLREYFAQALAIDYQAVFEEDLPDRVPIPKEAEDILVRLVEDLERFNFSAMPQEVVGNVFERLIPREERHKFGQYFTREELVDLINAFCIRNAGDAVLDPTCGSGTFLLRAYDRLKDLGDNDHQQLIPRLWGMDIARFPAELATISLYRLSLRDFHNFPRIVATDFFEVKPGQTFLFPPPKPAADAAYKLEQPLPSFDAAVGNFPYIRQELIEKRIPGYKAKLYKLLFDEWKNEYPALFKNGKVRISGQADIYVYLFFHTARFLKPDGRMGFVTSNAWLDVAYGYELQKFLLKHFKIIAILESRCEPWFEDPAINTVVTILEWCADKSARDNHLVNFVKVKQKLKELIPYDMKFEAHQRWHALKAFTLELDGLGSEFFKTSKQGVAIDLEGHHTYENERYRCRVIRQSELLEEAEKADRTVKWGRYLRAPEVYFELFNASNKFFPLHEFARVKRGFTTGINEFFYLDDERINHWKIEKQFLAPIIKSPREIDNIKVRTSDASLKVFLCNEDKAELKKLRAMGALKYIEWGESQRTRKGQKEEGGIPYPKVKTVQSRKIWYSLSDQELANLIWIKGYDKKYRVAFSRKKFFLDQQLYGIFPISGINIELLAAVLNSTIFYLGIELCGRIPFGEGVLWTSVEEAENYTYIPNLNLISSTQADRIKKAFQSLLNRETKDIFEEVKCSDRQALDKLILRSLNLDPNQFLKPLYEGITQLVSQRLELAKLRKKMQNASFQKDVDKLKKFVEQELLPEGPRPFPKSFLDSRYLEDREEISTPGPRLRLGRFFMGRQEVLHETNKDYRYEAKNLDEAKFIIYSQNPYSFITEIPRNPIALRKAVQSFEKYLGELRSQIYHEFASRTLDQKLAQHLTQELWIEFGLPDIPE